ncbi:ADA regulatory protein / Methylated-DNA-protein-cysteine methyltransferase [Klebsiella pneumoniae]|uniref:ADA regulatory protein / Methylated-DNA-protein-cysteine methyltransferase n=1 Tax=Klebsiella pneumoniae TaxID=573 RepID=A0A2X3GXY0_KLEPN|nr:ADA regulatory protein / Methylated-DNA-protein-cysteine methyltransferase [Klebsiella pneumoniae]
MKPIVADTDDRRWQAVCERDTRADGQFVFAVLDHRASAVVPPAARGARGEKTYAFLPTSPPPWRRDSAPANAANRIKTTRSSKGSDKVAQACRLLEQDAPLTLEALAGQLAMSPFHFHRLFKSVTGMTPKSLATSVAGAAPAGSAGAGDTGDPRRAGGWFSRQQQLLIARPTQR